MLRLLLTVAALAPGMALAGMSEGSPGLPAYILQLPDSVENILIAETNTSTVFRYKVGPDGVERRDVRYMSVGENGVGKQRAWDRRTPLGIYFANEQLDTRRMHERYGPTAFPLDYPNAWDNVRQRTGDGIWIHGVDPRAGRRPPLDTDGCIALPNDELLSLEEHLQLLITPVIITRRIASLGSDEFSRVREEHEAALDSGASKFADVYWHTYLARYADSFEYRGLSRDE